MILDFVVKVSVQYNNFIFPEFYSVIFSHIFQLQNKR